MDLAELHVVTKYEDATDMIKGLVGWFVRNHGGDYEEIKAEANLLFMECINGGYGKKHNPGTSPFMPWCRFVIMRGLISHARKIAVRGVNLPRTKFDHKEMCAKEHFNINRLMEELSPDGAKAIRLVLEPNNDMKMALASRRYPDSPSAHKSALYEVLSDIGWEDDRIEAAFDEIKEALI